MSAGTVEVRTACEPWCVDHEHGGKYPEDAFCCSELVTIAGIELKVSNGTHDNRPALFVIQTAHAPETTSKAAALALAERLTVMAALLD